ncbi:hypothetical protein FE257_010888 [Aspergillus nanangensis]|uniref:Uncharacterized protein n=1 Tax=Aspergillus nanangensis TaxID=2582783 RepID=A0AAD4GY58_ASPNN|nr:hypothetical protein FE257_010888 [Aspergillus nanangensis]
MAPRPNLYPIQTSKTIVYPSELQGPSTSSSTSSKREDSNGPSVPPPLAYTEFLRALSPAFGSPEPATAGATRWSFGRPLPSPISMPSTSSSASFPRRTVSGKRTSSMSVPHSPALRSASSIGPIRRIRMSPTYMYSPASTESPQSPYMIRTPLSPAEWRRRYAESPDGRTISIQQVVTHTITLKRTPSLDPPPKGKRRRTHESHDR